MTDAPTGIAPAIRDLKRMIEDALAAARSGQMIETDLLTMRIAVLCDALAEADRGEAVKHKPLIGELAQRLGELDDALRRQNVDLQLNIAQLQKSLGGT